ncbi:hypothetical protein BK809_0000310 [Diplodia seriata]|uniref:Aspartic-type endopeptidase n=1 Tax=Diplodia seriata TaxID=420778 RepID=A0A1S8BAE1_9PEZI|nr:hypothetical protein BK809_0000310 [Diplodia seriata]
MAGAYPSMSYGLHIGSAMHQIPGKLFYGGYDRARCITPPITMSLNSTFSLADIAIGVASGDSAFLNTAGATFIDGLLQSNISGVSVPFSTQPDPGIPYLYLPAATCAAIARHLPVTYNAGLGLYLWNTSDPAYPAIVSSPHYLSFHFHTSRGTSDNTTQAIAVPFALFNLTLTYPVAATDTSYFPCRPYDSEDVNSATVFLGRAFLQAAHLAHNWHTSTAWLAQAPGPRHSAVEEEVKSIDPADTTLSKLPAAPLWNDTWTGVLVPLERGGAAAAGNGSLAGAGDGGSGGLSDGAKAGIGIGVVVGVVGIGVGAWLWWGRRRRRRGGKAGEKRTEILGRERAAGLDDGGFAGVVQRPPEELDGAEMQELPAESERVKELHGKPVQLVHELPGGNRVG